MKKFISSVMAMVIFAVPVSVYAMPNIEYDNMTSIESSCEVFVKQTEQNDYSILREFGANNIKRLKQKIALGNLDSNEIYVRIFNELGIKINPEIDGHKVFLANMENAASVQSSTQYVKIDKYNNKETMSEEALLRQMKKEENLIKRSRSANNSNILVSDNGYLKQTLLVITDSNISGKYVIIAQHEWLKTPVTRSVDAFSLYSNKLTWGNLGRGLYSKITSYKENGPNGREFWNEEKIDPVINLDGPYYSWRLPVDRQNVFHSNLLVQMYATAYAVNDNQRTLDVHSKYAHAQLGVTSSIGWSSGSGIPGVTLNGVIKQQEYYNYLQWAYVGDYK